MSRFLSTIQSPADVKQLNFAELRLLAEEIRERIIEVMSVNGGHLGSSLGSIELILALHKVFDAPLDKLIFDVSHQSYPHKMITGRNHQFDKIRQYKGLCGFSHPGESPYDHFYAGHAGTSISLGLGCALSRDLMKTTEHIIPVIGDATLTCGLALEGLNNISKTLKNFIILLNDNAMSISNNVGCITDILSTCDFSLKKTASSTFFEQFNLQYVGPIDGHDIEAVAAILENIKNQPHPIVLHVLTQKGKGMDEAIRNPITYHGARPFDKVTGKFHPGPNTKTFPKIFGKHLLEMAKKDDKIVAVTPAMSLGSCLDPMIEAFPDRCIDVGIAEGHSVTFAGGIGYNRKMKVVSTIYSTFLHRALDNLFHDVCLQRIPVVFAIDRAFVSAPDGSTHHGIYDISFLNAMPNMVITQPRNGQVLKELLESAFTYDRPTAIRYPNLTTTETDEPLKYIPIGKGEILKEGEELLIIALGHMNEKALKVMELLKLNGIHPTLFDPVFVKPLDSETLCTLLSSHDKVVTLEEHSAHSGMGAILNHFIMQNGFQNIQVLNLGIPETFLEMGSHEALMDEIGLSPEKIADRILHFFTLKKTETLSPFN